MISAPEHAARRAFLVFACVVTWACASGLPTVDAGDLPRLRQAVAASPDDTDLQVQLAMAQFSAGDYAGAYERLSWAVDAGNESGAAYLYLGMSAEELENWSAARDAYTTYLNVGTSTSVRSEVRSRLTLIGRNLLRARARQALTLEEALRATGTVTPRSIAVLPMAFNSDDPELEPLIYALADMMITDFKVSRALIVLERAQIQALLDEMELGTQGYAEPGTGARAGRILSAEHVVQGVLTPLGGQELQTDTEVLEVLRATSAGQVDESGALEQIFDLEKQIVIRTIRDVLGLELTPAEEQRILENRMSNVLAFLAHGRGLRELDRGNFQAAQAEFEQALQLEGGGYDATEAALAETNAILETAGTTTEELGSLAGSSGETGVGVFGPPTATVTSDLSAMGIAPPPPAGTGQSVTSTTSNSNVLRNIAEGIDPTPTAGTLDLGSANVGQDQTTQQSSDTVRDPVQEGTNDDNIASPPGTSIRIVITRPGAGQ
jgi:Tfp pilus assembly protein PilF/TolB-like protein